jgi:hypothetical protein
MRAAWTVVATVLTAAALSATGGPPIDIPARARGAERILVARVLEVHAAFERNEFGDQLIVSRAQLQTEEILKGPHTDRLEVEVEGGTIGDLTLRVSDMPSLQAGDRAVFFLKRGGGPDTFVPHLRGLGILKVEQDGSIREGNLTLNLVRTTVRGAVR